MMTSLQRSRDEFVRNFCREDRLRLFSKIDHEEPPKNEIKLANTEQLSDINFSHSLQVLLQGTAEEKCQVANDIFKLAASQEYEGCELLQNSAKVKSSFNRLGLLWRL